jgi:hypothetical protein
VGSDNAFKLAFDFHDDGNDARFCIRNVQSTNNSDTITEVFTVDNGNVSCTGDLSCSTLHIGGSDSYYYLLNNTGGSHGDMNGDFNNVGNFGCKFVHGAATNGPGAYSTYNQWYAMSMGLGSNYNFCQFFCQIAIPRNTKYPTLSNRFKESGSWGSRTG